MEHHRTTARTVSGMMLHANEKAVAAMYAALENRAAQLRMIAAAAKSALPLEYCDVISVLIKVSIRPTMRYRDN
jgi:hypothetical protein